MFLFLFLFLLVSFWVVAAWLMTEHTNMGVAVFVADNTSMCGIWSDGAAAVLSSCSLVRCSSHQFVSPYREVLLQGTHPPCTISCKALVSMSITVRISQTALQKSNAVFANHASIILQQKTNLKTSSQSSFFASIFNNGFTLLTHQQCR